jgi:predicted nucleic acid-binding protein
MANTPHLLYWDTDVFIHRFQKTPAHITILEQLTDAAERGEIMFVQSTFTIAELVKDPEGEKLTVVQESLIEDFFENDFVTIRTLTEQIAFLARKIAREYGVKPGDAVHVATALFWKVPILHTFDNKLLNKTKLMSDLSIKIEKPAWVGKPLPLLDSAEASEVSDEEESDSTASEAAETVSAEESHSGSGDEAARQVEPAPDGV